VQRQLYKPIITCASVAISTPVVCLSVDVRQENATNYATLILRISKTGGSSTYVRYVFVNDCNARYPVQDVAISIYTENQCSVVIIRLLFTMIWAVQLLQQLASSFCRHLSAPTLFL